jgi:galactose mutarotase-like enzyme
MPGPCAGSMTLATICASVLGQREPRTSSHTTEVSYMNELIHEIYEWAFDDDFDFLCYQQWIHPTNIAVQSMVLRYRI